MRKGLTKMQLLNLGLYVCKDENAECGYRVERYWYKNGGCKSKSWQSIKVVDIPGPVGKYSGNRLVYKGIVLSLKNTSVTFVLSRVVYAWFVGDIPDNYDIDHIDGNTFNNSLDNLQLLSHKDNIIKRGVGRNQYSCYMSESEIMENRISKESFKKELDLLHNNYKQVRDGLKKAKNDWHKALEDFKFGDGSRDNVRRAKDKIDYFQKLCEDAQRKWKEKLASR